jgi:CRP-like cAMP-binding protein
MSPPAETSPGVEGASPGSCIVDQFQRLATLDEDECALLAALEGEIQAFEPDQVLQAAGHEASHFFSLQSGWACAIRLLPDGQRQVLDIFLPNQIMGLHELGLPTAQSDLVAITEVQACAFARDALEEVCRRSPRLSELFFLSLAGEQATLSERIINIGRRPASQRLAHFLLEMQMRQDPSRSTIDLPMNQSLIGDALGLSAVHVSRTLGELRDRGWIETNSKRMTLLDRDALIELCDFDPGYLGTRNRQA